MTATMTEQPTTCRSPLAITPVLLRDLVTPKPQSWETLKLKPNLDHWQEQPSTSTSTSTRSTPPPIIITSEFNYITAEQFHKNPIFKPAPGEHVNSDSICKCGIWNFQSLPVSLGGCGHVYKLVRYSCKGQGSGERIPCPEADFSKKIRSANYILGFCPTCERNADPQTLENHRRLLEALSGKGSDAFDVMIHFFAATQLFFIDEQRKVMGLPPLWVYQL